MAVLGLLRGEISMSSEIPRIPWERPWGQLERAPGASRSGRRLGAARHPKRRSFGISFRYACSCLGFARKVMPRRLLRGTEVEGLEPACSTYDTIRTSGGHPLGWAFRDLLELQTAPAHPSGQTPNHTARLIIFKVASFDTPLTNNTDQLAHMLCLALSGCACSSAANLGVPEPPQGHPNIRPVFLRIPCEYRGGCMSSRANHVANIMQHTTNTLFHSRLHVRKMWPS